jgi:hypothetical protein
MNDNTKSEKNEMFRLRELSKDVSEAFKRYPKEGMTPKKFKAFNTLLKEAKAKFDETNEI